MTELPVTELPWNDFRSHRTDVLAPSDLDAFWARTIEAARGAGEPATFEPVPNPLALLDTYDVTFAGFGGEPVRAWLHLPRHLPRPLPCVVQFIGYGGGRGLAHETTLWATAGYAHLVVDTRGQGSSGSTGVTADPNPGRPETPGVLTRGILDPETYYYRRVFTDGVRAVDAVRAHPDIDGLRVAAVGGSQGGAIALAVSALHADVAAALIDVPFLCDIRRAAHLAPTLPYRELVSYLAAHRDHVAAVFATLAYFDGAVLAQRAHQPALFSVGLMDEVCPPSTVYAAYHGWAGPKAIEEYEFNGHEGGGPFHQTVQLEWLADTLALGHTPPGTGDHRSG